MMRTASALEQVQSNNVQQVAEGLSLEPQPATGSEQHSAETRWPSQEQMERIRQDSRLSALVGQNVVLNCAVQFKDGIEKPFVVNWLKYPHKLPIYIWYAGYPPHVAQGYEARVSRIGQASLNLSQVRESDQGLYECKIYYLDRRPEDKGSGTWIYLDVQAPPHFSQVPSQVSYVQAGDSLRLTCQAESTPSPVLRWYKNKTPIETDGGAYRLWSPSGARKSAPNPGAEGAALAHFGGQSSSQLDLFIDNVQAGTTTGEYKCLASNSEGSVEARSQVLLAVPAVITGMPRNQTRLEGERVELQCQAKALPSNITYKWLFNEKPIQTLKWFEARHTLRRDGTLVIHSVHRDDQGTYKCQATNGLAHRASRPPQPGSSVQPAPIYAEAQAQLTVEYPARISHSPSVQYLPAGLSGQVRCFVQAAPPVEFFTWTLNNQQFDPNVDSNVERLSNGSLLIKEVSKKYEGKYRCTPFNKHGSAGSSAAMEVRVEEPPQFTLRPAEFYKANVNGHVKIACDAQGQPRPNISWRRVLPAGHHQSGANQNPELSSEEPSPAQSNSQDSQAEQSVIGEQIYSKLPSDRSEYKNSHLILHGLRKEDHGRYECVVENEVATLVASTMLYIEETTPHAPINVHVDTKAWSAQVSWTPGYDGGFEQSFVIWYRQVEHPTRDAETNQNQAGPLESLDLNWKSVNVQPPDASLFTVQNLSQDTTYEFSVRARNIIGEGPRSVPVQATTKRAISGSLTPIDQYTSDGSQSRPLVPSSVQQQRLDQWPDQATAPQNVSMMKVAQGWVLSWLAPKQAPAEPAVLARIEALASQAAAAGSQHLLAANSLDASSLADSANQPAQSQGDQHANNPVAAYSIELREKGTAWHQLATSRELSLLLKDLKPGGEYMFRVSAHSSSGARGAPSQEFRYTIPDNRRKPGSTQALSAGVVSGVLFFIASIVIAVCTVNMCNKRRKKRAEKAAYVMMACPVLESQHDFAALNSNSLMKNSSDAAQSRVSGLEDGRRLYSKLTWRSLAHQAAQLLRPARPAGDADEPSTERDRADATPSQGIEFTTNAPLPVDVSPPKLSTQASPEVESQRPLDDYWLRDPSDRKWGTLTLAAGKLAERRAKAGLEPSNVNNGGVATSAVATLMRGAGCGPQVDQSTAGSRTLPRSFRENLIIRPMPMRLASQQELQCQADQSQLGMHQSDWTQYRPVHSEHLSQFYYPQQSILSHGSHYTSANGGGFSQIHQRSRSHIEAPNASIATWQPYPYELASGQLTYWQDLDLADSNLQAGFGKRNSYSRATLPLSNYEHLFQPPPPLQPAQPVQPITCPFYPLLNVAESDRLANDDPLLTNACLGSYKRKRKLPHIEAQFTMTRSPEQEELTDGELFVRPAVSGCPPAGQKSEQRRLMRPPAEFAQVSEIGPEEKIESYLRHCERSSEASLAQRDSPGARAGESVELDELDCTEVTFQPYYNLASLKYTFQLPIHKAPDGRLLMDQTSHLRARRRHGSTPGVQPDSRPPSVARRKSRLGSSSSCPASAAVDPATALSRLSLDSARPIGPRFKFDPSRSIQPDSLDRSLDQSGAAGELVAPPIPPHRNRSGAFSAGKTASKGASPDSNSSSSAATTTEEAANNSESLTNDHSVDENYEFDLISSCSSMRQARSGAHQHQPKARLRPSMAPPDLYAQVDKPKLSIRSRLYENSTLKEQPIQYDTVYEVPPKEPDHAHSMS